MASITAVIAGLEVLSKYLKDGDRKGYVEGQHDIIFVGPEIKKDTPTQKDVEFLEKIGWHFDKEYDCWAIFT